MISLRRFALAILLASLVNTLLFTVVFRDSEAFLDGAALTVEYWMMPPLGLVAAVEFFSFAWTGAGLMLLMAIAKFAIPHAIPFQTARLLFVGVGAGVGWGLFGLWLESQLSMAVFGAVSALTFVLICPRWFAAWDKTVLAES